MSDPFQLLVEGPAVAGDLPEVPLYSHEFFSSPVLGVLYDCFRQSHLARKFECERISRQPHLKLEQRRDVLYIEHHRSVHHTCLSRCIELQVRVVGGYDSVCASLVQFAEYGLCDGSTCRRFGSGSELVYEHERLVVGLFQHVLHVLKEGAVGTQVVVDRLVVSDVHHDAVEDHEFGCLRCRYQHTPLEHVLEESDGLQADRLSSRIRSRDQKYVLLRGQGRCQRHDLLLFLLERTLEKRMACLAEVHLAFLRNDRHSCDEVEGDLGLCHDEVYLAEIFRPVEKVRYVRTQEFREFEQDAHNLPLLGELELLYLVVQLHDFRRLDEGRLSGRGLVVYESGYLLLVGGAYRYQHLSVSHRYTGVAVNYAFFLGLLQYCAHPS